MVKEYRIQDGQLAPCEDHQGLVKVFISPDVVERNYLEHTCKISPHNISSAMDPDEIGRMEFEEDHTMIIIKSPKNYSSSDNFLFRVTSVGVFLYKDQLIIIMNNQETSILEGRQTFKLTTLHDALLKILYGTIAHFLGHLKVINLLSDSLEQKINTSMANEHLLNMFTIEKSLIYYLNGINSNSVVIEKLKTNAPRIGFSPENVALLDDIAIENNQCNKQAEIYSNILTGLNDARGSIVNNNMNQLIKQLTILSVVFMPLNVIAGVGGMSEFSMMTQGIPWPISYSVMTVGLIGVAFLTWWILNKFMKQGHQGATPMIIRSLGDADIPAARDFWATIPGLGLGASDEPEALSSFFARNPNLSWAAFDGDRLAATVLAGHDGRRGFLYHLAVGEADRGQGLSTDLMTRALGGLAQCGIAKVHAFVLTNNSQGLAFWASAARRGWSRRGDILLFSKNL